MTVANKRIFTDVFGDIITNVRAEYDIVNTPKATPYYLFGQSLAIKNEIIEKKITDRYPLIILGIDSDYIERDINRRQYEVSFNCWIVDETKKEWYTSDRFEQVYATILFPIYKLLKEKIETSEYVDDFGIQDFQPEVRLFPYWGSSNEQVLSDPLDALGIKINNLLIKNNC